MPFKVGKFGALWPIDGTNNNCFESKANSEIGMIASVRTWVYGRAKIGCSLIDHGEEKKEKEWGGH